MSDCLVPRRALICGVSGQDGSYLAQLLLSKGYEVWGTSRNAQGGSFSGLIALGIRDSVKLRSMSPVNFQSVLQTINDVQPQEIYNLAGQSSVGVSFEEPRETIESIVLGTSNLLEAIRHSNRSIRFYNAGSSECFGDTDGNRADESTSFHPRSPYALAKASAAFQVAVYRESYGLYACTGILSNHESPLRPERFVTKKIVTTVRRIAGGSNEKLYLGNIDIWRDWGWAPEYVDAMWRMLNFERPEDFVLATGTTISLKQFAAAAFEEAGLDWHAYVIADPSLQRLTDPLVREVCPDKAKRLLGWNPVHSGVEVARKMYLVECGQ